MQDADGLKSALEAAVRELNSRKPIADEAMLSQLKPVTAVSWDPASTESVRSSISEIKNKDWQEALRSLVDATRGTSAPDGAEDAAASEKLRFDARIRCIRALTRIVSREKLWATRILAQNCEELSDKACETGAREHLDEAANVIRQAFRITVNDHQAEEPKQGRTRCCYDIAVALVRVYVRLQAYSLAEGIMHAVDQYAVNLPELSASPWKTQVQFLFYKGTFYFHEQKYTNAVDCLDRALAAAEYLTPNQFECIMLYNITASYLALNRTPSESTWSALPRLQNLLLPLIDSARAGCYEGFSEALKRHSDILRQNRLYLACDTMVVRLKLNLLRRVWELSGRPKRLPIQAYADALMIAKLAPDGISTTQAAEFYIAQYIMRGEVKGYIHHKMALLMLSKTRPFPTLVTYGADEQ